MSTATLTYHRRARWTLEQLSEEEQKEIREAVNSLVDLPLDRWPSDRVKLIDPERSRYMLLATSYWRVFFNRSATGEIDVDNIMNKEAIRVLGGHGPGAGSKG